MDDVDAEQQSTFPGYLFSFKGRIGRRKYFIGIGVALATLIATFGFAASAMDSTGGGAVALLALPLFALFVWMLAAITVQRLRDAKRPPALAVAFIVAPILLLYPALELIEYGGPLIALAVLAIVFTPGVMKSRA